MSKAFTREDGPEDEEVFEPARPSVRNLITPQGLEHLRDELQRLRGIERPRVVEVVSWAAGNGDRSENGDYIYGKRRLREIDSRIRFLTRRIASAEPVDPARQVNREQVFFGAHVTYVTDAGEERTVRIIGVDEADLHADGISWVSPIARALLRSFEGDHVVVDAPGGRVMVKVVKIDYPDA